MFLLFFFFFKKKNVPENVPESNESEPKAWAWNINPQDCSVIAVKLKGSRQEWQQEVMVLGGCRRNEKGPGWDTFAFMSHSACWRENCNRTSVKASGESTCRHGAVNTQTHMLYCFQTHTRKLQGKVRAESFYVSFIVSGLFSASDNRVNISLRVHKCHGQPQNPLISANRTESTVQCHSLYQHKNIHLQINQIPEKLKSSIKKQTEIGRLCLTGCWKEISDGVLLWGNTK